MSDKPATYGDVFAVREYRYLFGANLLSLLGDYLAALALGLLVFQVSGSSVLTAASFASPFVAWIVGGPVLSVLADRLPRRALLIACDLSRAALFLILSLPRVPAAALVGIAFLAHLFHAPFLSARASLIPEILAGDRYTVANGLENFLASVGQVLGFAAGGLLLTVFSPRNALVLDALTFVGSALLIRCGMSVRPPASAAEQNGDGGERGIASLTAGVRLVFGNRTLRAYVLLVWLGCAFTYAPEGLIVSLNQQYGADARGVGLLFAAAPTGAAIGNVWVTRLCSPARRQRLIVPLALLSCAMLIPAVVHPQMWLLVILFALAGFFNCYNDVVNALFGRAVANEYRARAFGVAITGLLVGQGLAILLAGLFAEGRDPMTVVAASGVLGTLAVAAVALHWPRTSSVAAPPPEASPVSTAGKAAAGA